MTYGIFGTYLLNGRFNDFGNLPAIPKDYTLFKVDSDEDVNAILNIMKIKNHEIDIEYPKESLENTITLGGCHYEDECFLVSLLFTTIFDYWTEKREVEYSSNPTLLASFDCLLMDMWCWIREEITTEELKITALNFYENVMKFN